MRTGLLLLLLLGFLASCETELPLPAPSDGNKIVLIGELVANDSIRLRAGKSKTLGEKSKLLQNLQVSITEPSGSVTALHEYSDVASLILYTLPFSNSKKIQEGSLYTVRAKHPELGEVSAEVQVPGPFTATLAGKQNANYAGDSVLQVEIDINQSPGSGGRYLVEVLQQYMYVDGYFFYNSMPYDIRFNRSLYDSLKTAGASVSENFDTSYSDERHRQQFYINDPQSDNGSTGGRLFSRLYLSAEKISGSKHRTQIHLPRINLYPISGVPYAQTIVYVKSIPEDYYDYLKAYDAYYASPEPGGGSAPEKLTGNVKGGFGMIGGVYSVQFHFIY